jgi:hypothetical protein
MSWRWRDLAALVMLAILGACAKTPPSAPTVIAMAMPAPPPRVPVPVVLPEPVEPPPAEPEPPAMAPAAPRRNPTTASRPTERPAAPPTAEPATPAPVLQTTADVSSKIEIIRAKVDEAERKLNGLNFKELNVQERAQYDQARGFVRRANQALRIRNYLYAEQLARKAAAVANQLGRG